MKGLPPKNHLETKLFILTGSKSNLGMCFGLCNAMSVLNSSSGGVGRGWTSYGLGLPGFSVYESGFRCRSLWSCLLFPSRYICGIGHMIAKPYVYGGIVLVILEAPYTPTGSMHQNSIYQGLTELPISLLLLMVKILHDLI